jgi:hypothetical protein
MLDKGVGIMTECNRTKKCTTCKFVGFDKNAGHTDGMLCYVSLNPREVDAGYVCKDWRCDENCVTDISFIGLRKAKFECPVKSVLEKSNRTYHDETQEGNEGNYLYDFLRRYGEGNIRSINFHKGSPNCVGDGVVFV